MNKILLIVMLVVSFGYSDARQDIRVMSKAATKCANKDVIKHLVLMGNIYKKTDIDFDYMANAIALYLKYLENECRNESRIIINILDKYTKQAQVALVMRIISQQMYNISSYFKDASDRFDEYESIVLDDF